MAKYVISGSKIKCTFGTTQGMLTVMPNTTNLASGALATIMDHKPIVNINPCGMCRSLTNPTVASATSAALGVLTPMPCLPNTTSPWLMGKPDFTVKNKPVLMDNARLMCTWGGIITIASVGKTAEDKAEKVKEDPPECPICGKVIQRDDKGNLKEGSKYCRDITDLTLCPNKDEQCLNKNGDIRKGCDGYQRGNVGFGMMLGNNILVNRYKITREGYDPVTYLTSKMSDKYKDGYREKAMESFLSTLKDTDPEFQEKIKAEVDKINDDIKNVRQQKRKAHPLHKGIGSIEAHHLICTEALNNEQWMKICKATGYNINCQLNGVYMTNLASVACYFEMQRHDGPHNLGRGDKIDGARKSYVRSVIKKIQNISENFDGKECKENTIEKFIKRINKVSKTICENIRTFTWSVAWDGFGYDPKVKPKIGCANVDGIKDKREVLKSVVPKGTIKWSELSFNDMKDIQGLPEGTLDSVFCKKDHSTDLKDIEIKMNKTEYKFEVGY